MRSDINSITGTTKQDYYYKFYIPDDQYIGTFTFSSYQTVVTTDQYFAVYVSLICFENKDKLNDLGIIPTGEYTTLWSGWIRSNTNNTKTTVPINYVVDSVNKPTFYLVISNTNGFPITFKSHVFYYFRIYTATGYYIERDNQGHLFYSVRMTSTLVTADYKVVLNLPTGEWFELKNIELRTGGGVVDKKVTYQIGTDKPIEHTVSDGDTIYLDSRFINRFCLGPKQDITITMTNFVAGDYLNVSVDGLIKSSTLPTATYTGSGTISGEEFTTY